MLTDEEKRIDEHYSGKSNWLKWGPYLSERQWGTIREDYSKDGNAWDYFPHDHARSRTYRWGEDGIGGISDEFQNLCFAFTFWNGKDDILKERLFGLSGTEGNHGEDVKELYYYLDNTPMHTYMKYLYKYPQTKFPYNQLIEINEHLSPKDPEYEILNTGIFDDNKYFDIFIEYAKIDEEDIIIKASIYNRGKEDAFLAILPTIWFRNKWSYQDIKKKPDLRLSSSLNKNDRIIVENDKIGNYYLYFKDATKILFTENETNYKRLYNNDINSEYVKDAFNRAVINNDFNFLINKTNGTKSAVYYEFIIPGRESVSLYLRLSNKEIKDPLNDLEKVIEKRKTEADDFYNRFITCNKEEDINNIERQAFAGLLWSKQFYHIDMELWLDGDPGYPKPPDQRKEGRNKHWRTLNNEDIILMPDKWEYPWYASWDLAFHCIPYALIDTEFAKNQIILFLREWYMKPDGQIPAYEWSFSDVNPPVFAMAVLKIYEIEKKIKGRGDINFLKRVFNKLTLNFTWWVNRKDIDGNNVFEGGFLGLDNIGVFDRSKELPLGGKLEQADSTSWMAMYSANMMQIALEISIYDISFEDVATKFFEHFVYIAESLNKISENNIGIWNEEEGFFFDLISLPNGKSFPLKVRSLVGLTTLFGNVLIKKTYLDKLQDFKRHLLWFRNYRIKFRKHLAIEEYKEGQDILLSLVPKERLKRILTSMFNEDEFLAPGGIRSISKIHKNGFIAYIENIKFELMYEPGESTTTMFGGNSNWRGPIWIPMNYLIIQSLLELHKYYGNNFKIDFPTGSGNYISLKEIASNLSQRILSIFLKDEDGKRPVHGRYEIYSKDKYFKDLILFYEYFHGDNSCGLGASHQTGWTSIINELIFNCIYQE